MFVSNALKVVNHVLYQLLHKIQLLVQHVKIHIMVLKMLMVLSHVHLVQLLLDI